MLLSGGHDTAYTTDPKLPDEVAAGVDLPPEDALVAVGKLRFGPHFRPLASRAEMISFLNGVQVGTANHETGLMQYLRLKTNGSERMPSFLDIVANKRDGQPAGVIYLNVSHRDLHSPHYLGSADRFYFGSGDVFEWAAQEDHDRVATAARVLRKRARELSGFSGASAMARDHLDEAAALLERLPSATPLSIDVPDQNYTSAMIGVAFQRAHWLMENDLCAGIFLDLGNLGWDTHINNRPKQESITEDFMRHLVAFLTKIESTKNEHGRLLDNTVMIAGSELGRFPKINDMLGKDHFPQTGFMFLGPWVAGGSSFGETGEMMEGLPVSSLTGRCDGASRRVPVLDDVGTTLLHLAGLDPTRYGYTGQVLKCLLG